MMTIAEMGYYNEIDNRRKQFELILHDAAAGLIRNDTELNRSMMKHNWNYTFSNSEIKELNAALSKNF